MLVGGSTLLSANRGRTYGYSSFVELSAQKYSDGSFNICIDSEGESGAIGSLAVERVVEQINEKQSLNIDTVTGATVSSAAALESAAKALAGVGFDTNELKQKQDLLSTADITEHCDVVVVGAGGAGLTAAISAAKAGAKVIVVEKLGIPGGSTARSDGKIAATGSSLQQYFGVVDNVSSFAGYMMGYSDEKDSQNRIMLLAEHSGANIDFLSDCGVRFSENILSISDEEDAQRDHVALDKNGNAGGAAIVLPLLETAKELGVRFIYESTVNGLLRSVYGDVEGVKATTKDGGTLTVKAGATILATGGYDRASARCTEYNAHSTVPAASYSGVGGTGDGVLLAEQAGAKILEGSLMAELYDFSLNTNSEYGLLITPRGDRFVNESLGAFELGSALQERGFSNAYMLFDSVTASAAVRDAASDGSGKVISSTTMMGLEAALKCSGLSAAVNRYNLLCDSKLDSDYGKERRYMKPLDSGPFYAVPYELASYGTLGGIRSNNKCQAMSAISVVPGLYAAGEVSNGAYFRTGIPDGGVTLAQVVETGRIAGQNAATFALTGDNY